MHFTIESNNRVYDQIMPYLPEHLSSLRQEITQLRNVNGRYSEKKRAQPDGSVGAGTAYASVVRD